MSGYGPVQLADHLDLELWQLQRAVAAGLIPAAGSDGRWPDDVAEQALALIASIRPQLGSIPDVGAWRAAAILAKRFGIDMTPDGVRELARAGLIPVAGKYRDKPLFDGRALEAFTDREAAVRACRDGKLLLASAAARHMRIRGTDFAHLLRAGRVKAHDWVRGPWPGYSAVYRAGDLDVLLGDESIDWDAVRAVGKGCRSPLAGLPSDQADAEAS